ncbi:MAG TPA: pyridoxal phosphate-dependent aminotransferase [Candidatus Deferrimicrobium sp.]|nr:pyridoxal phosphate-dependent aminotransferase [Candidatus Deferrimicrobium sp.]
MNNYLNWYRDVEMRTAGRNDVCRLMSSAMHEPIELLQQDLEELCGNAKTLESLAWTSFGYSDLAARVAARYGVDPHCVVTTNGVSNGVYLIYRALLLPRAHVVLESPVYEPLEATAQFIGAEISYVQRRPPDYAIDPDDLRRAMRPDTRLVILTNLHNPTGTLLSDEHLHQLARAATDINPSVKIVVDEVYHDFVFATQRPAAALGERFISVNSLTKVYGLGSLHCGWVIADPATVETIRQLQVVIEGSYSRLLESLAVNIIERADDYLSWSLQTANHNREMVRHYLDPFIRDGILEGAVSKHGCIWFPKISLVNDSSRLVAKLAETRGVYIVPGRFFGQPQHVRIGFGGPTEELATGLKILVAALQDSIR